MQVKYYIIRGRGEDGKKFQLANLEDEQGNIYKGQYDQARQFASIDELEGHIAEVVKCEKSELNISPMKM